MRDWLTTTDWLAFADRCLNAGEPDSDLARELSRAFMARDDYPTVGTLVSNVVALGHVNSAFMLVEILFPTYGCQVRHPLRIRDRVGWYASVFRERRKGEPFHPHPGSFEHAPPRAQGDYAFVYASDPALAIMAALCRALNAQAEMAKAAVKTDSEQ